MKVPVCSLLVGKKYIIRKNLYSPAIPVHDKETDRSGSLIAIVRYGKQKLPIIIIISPHSSTVGHRPT